MTDTSDLVARLRTREPYKHALEIMADAISEWLRDVAKVNEDPFTMAIFLGQGDYPTGLDIIAHAVRKMNEAADCIEALEAKLAKAMEALEEIAKQMRTDELETEYDVEYADFEGGYDACIDRARATLHELKGGDLD